MKKKYIIALEDRNVWSCGLPAKTLLQLDVSIFGTDLSSVNTGIELTPYTEPDTEKVGEEALEAIREEVLEAVNRIYDIPQDDRGGIFPKATYYVSDIVQKYSASEIIEKIRQYEQKQKQEECDIKYDQIRQGLLNVAKACNAKAAELSEVLAKMKEES